MKTSAKLFALGMVLLGFGLNANAQVSATASANASARIVSPITITKDVDLSYGNVVSSLVAGTVILPPTASATRTGSAGVALPTVTGTVTAAKFTVGGEAGLSYAISLPASATLTAGGNNMTLNTFTTDLTSGGSIGTTNSFFVGATLNVGAGQATGSYTGTFSVTVNYN
jgi:hypothetical protein